MTVIKTTNAGRPGQVARFILTWASMLLALQARATSFSEPCTVFYGRIIAIGSTQPFLLTEGDLTWTIRRPDGIGIMLNSNSARSTTASILSTQRAACSTGLDSTVRVGRALATLDQTQTHFRIAVTATGANHWSFECRFDVSQARRAATYRLDLAVPIMDSIRTGTAYRTGGRPNTA
jgi:hypothetical protein